jgi:hypothetical protein
MKFSAFRPTALTVVALGLFACGGSDEDGDDPFGPSRSCRAAPLSQFCASAACPDYEAAVGATRQHAATFPGVCFATIGTCGSYRYTFVGTGFTGTSLYFDRSGRVVAAETFSDAIDPRNACGASTFYGTVPRCAKVVIENACRPAS